MKKKLILAGALVALVGALALGQAALEARTAADADAQEMVEVPLFEVDPLWPQPLPNHWILGNAVGVGVDSRDHVYIIHRRQSFNPVTEGNVGPDQPDAECCEAAPNILEFDPEGNLVGHFGGPASGYTWPESNHGLQVDPNDNIWIGGNGDGDSHVLVFDRNGNFLKQIGEPGQGIDNASRSSFSQPAKISFDSSGDEAYVADGYGNKRVVVLDAESGEFLRYWGAYGEEPRNVDLGTYDPDAEPARHFSNPVHCAEPSEDGLIYVCDRVNDRIQVFRRDGTFVTEKFIAPRTLGSGSVWEIAFSADDDQRFLYLADGQNRKVYILDRQSLDVLTSFGDGGRQPGQFFGVHSIEVDSRGNLYTTETWEGKRVQKFVYQGLGRVEKGSDQGVVWPATD